MILSILICSLNSRSEQLKTLTRHLEKQINGRFESDIEIITEIDNKEITTGHKRNNLVNKAVGKYIVFIDDDDWVADYYVENMVWACLSDCDCIAINGNMTTDGGKEIKWRLSKDNSNVTIKENGVDLYLRKTNHITAVKREYAIKSPFPHKSNAEDKGYSDSINKYLKTEFKLEMPMYTYRFSTKNKEY